MKVAISPCLAASVVTAVVLPVMLLTAEVKASLTADQVSTRGERRVSQAPKAGLETPAFTSDRVTLSSLATENISCR